MIIRIGIKWRSADGQHQPCAYRIDIWEADEGLTGMTCGYRPLPDNPSGPVFRPEPLQLSGDINSNRRSDQRIGRRRDEDATIRFKVEWMMGVPSAVMTRPWLGSIYLGAPPDGAPAGAKSTVVARLANNLLLMSTNESVISAAVKILMTPFRSSEAGEVKRCILRGPALSFHQRFGLISGTFRWKIRAAGVEAG
jgi:hypothetical protein